MKVIPVNGGRGYVPVCETEQPREAPADEVVRGYITCMLTKSTKEE